MTRAGSFLVAACAAAGALLHGNASAAELSDLRFDANATRLALASQAAQPEATPGATTPGANPLEAKQSEWRKDYLEPGSWWGGVIAGYGRGLSDDSNDFNAAFTLSTFLVRRFELLMEFGGWYFDQNGDDALGANFNLLFRIHFLSFGERDKWTIFIDGGAGVLLSTDNVPDGGTGLNFTPRAGLGVTHRIGDSDTRLVFGGRWHHISNARVNGDDRNPGRDGVFFYAGVIFPF